MYIASISSDLKIHIWPDGQPVHSYKSNLQGCIKSISWSKDGSWLVLVPNKGPAEIISVRDNIKHLHSIQDIQQPTCATFQNTTKRNIALGTTTGIILIYDIKSKNVRKHFPRAPATIFKVEYCAKDSYLAAACDNGETLLYNSVTYNLSAAYKLPNSKTVSAIRCHPNRRNILGGGSQEGIVGVWDIHANKLIYNNQAHDAVITDLVFSPLRSDLIVTTGYDRKFAFYDMAQKNCLTQTILERSPTAVDFCPDGVGIAVALQDGTISAYDTRQLNQAMYSFKSHTAPVKQVLFQKKAMDNSATEYTFTNESTDSAEDVISPRNIAKVECSFDSFGHMYCGDGLPDIPEVPTDACSEMDAGDSFLDAIGLNSNNVTCNSARESIPSISENLKKGSVVIENNSHYSPVTKSSKTELGLPLQDTQRRPSETHLIRRVLPNLLISSDNVKVPKESTPKFPLRENDSGPTISPIVSGTNNFVTKEVLSQVVRDIVKEEAGSLHEKLKYELMDVIAQMRRQFLDLQMSIVKEFIQMETNVAQMREDFCGESGFGEECLIRENIKLRKELQSLRDRAVSNSDD